MFHDSRTGRVHDFLIQKRVFEPERSKEGASLETLEDLEREKEPQGGDDWVGSGTRDSRRSGNVFWVVSLFTRVVRPSVHFV